MASRQAIIREEREARAARLRGELSGLVRRTTPSGIGQRPIDSGDVAHQASASAVTSLVAVGQWDMADAAHHRRALCLIERTLGDVQDDSPRGSTPQGHRWVTEWSL